MAEMTDILVCPSLRPSGHFTDLAHKYASFLKFLTRLVVSKSIDLINEKIDATRSTCRWFFDRHDLADFRSTRSINYGVYRFQLIWRWIIVTLKGHWRSLKLVPFERLGAVSYSPICEIKRDIGRTSWLFHIPLAFDAPVRGGRSNNIIPFGMQKLEWWGYPMVKKLRICTTV